MMRATARIASGLSAVSTRRNSPQATTAGPECQTIETMGGTSRSALSRLVQASRKLLRVGGLEVGVTFQNPEKRANFSTVGGQAWSRAIRAALRRAVWPPSQTERFQQTLSRKWCKTTARGWQWR